MEKTNEPVIELTPLELAMLKANVDRTFFPPEATDEEKAAMKSVLDKAEAYMDKLNAYDELDNSLMEWYLAKYEKQQGISEPATNA